MFLFKMVKPIRILFLCLFFITFKSQAQHHYKNLVFEGGGIRGIAYCGTLQVLEKEGILDEVSRVAGTSVGAIQATLLALGYSSQEIGDIISELNIKHFNDGKLIFIGGFHRLIKKYGWYRGERLLRWLDELIKNKAENGDLTFSQLHSLSSKGKFKDLYITATNLTQQKVVVFSHENFPDMRIKDAVRISISIPLYFKAAFIDSLGRVSYSKTVGADIYVDGGILANFPIHLFDNKRYLTNEDSSRMSFNPFTLGIRLDTDDQIKYDQDKRGLAPYKINNFKDYLGAFYNIIIENLNRNELSEKDWERTISVSTVGVGPKIKRISSKDKNALIESGKKGAEIFLGKH